MKQPSSATFLMLILATAAQAEPSQYICTVDHGVGLHYDKQTNAWKTQVFAQKYVLRKLTDDDRKRWPDLVSYEANWAFFNLAENDPIPLVVCVDHGANNSSFTCKGFINVIRKNEGAFDKDSRRFEFVHYGEYINQGFWEQYRRLGDDESYQRLLALGIAQDTSHPGDLGIEIGTCIP